MELYSVTIVGFSFVSFSLLGLHDGSLLIV